MNPAWLIFEAERSGTENHCQNRCRGVHCPRNYQEEDHVSHIVTVAAELRDAAAIRAACLRRKLAAPIEGTVQLFSGAATGLAITLPGWQYPAVIDTASGQVRYDNFGGRWGAQQELDAFVQAYTIAKTQLEARKRGHSVTEQPLADGSVKLVIQLGGAA